MGNSVGSLFLDLNLNTKTFDKQLNSIGSHSTNVLDKTFKRIGKSIAGALGTAALGAFAKSCLDLGSDLAEVQNVVDVVFPSMNSQINSFSKNAISQFGLSETVAKRMTGTYGAMSKAFGFTEAQAYDMATSLTGLAGDVASFYNLDPTEAYTKIKSVFSGETETLKDLGIVMTQNALDQYAMANGYGKTTSAMTEQEKVMLRLNFVTEQLSSASGDFARTSDSWANKTRVLNLNFQSLKATIGQGLINVLSPVVSILNNLIAKLQKAAEIFVAFTSLISGTSKKTSDTLGSVSSGANAAAGSVSGIGDAAKKTAKQLGALAGFDELNNISTATGAGGASGGGSDPFGLDGMTNVGTIDTSNLEDGVNRAKEILEDFTSFFSDKSAIIISLCAGLGAGFGVFLLLTNFGAITAGAIKFLTVFTTLQTGIYTFFTQLKMGNGLMTAFSAVFGTSLGPIIAIAAGVAAVTAALVYLYKTSDSFRALVNTALSNLMSVLQNLWTSVLQPLCSFLGAMFTSVIMPMASFLASTFVGAVGTVAEVFLHLWNEILAPLANFLISRFGETFKSWSANAINAVSGVKNVFAGLSSFVSTYMETIKGVLKGIITFISGVFKGDWKKAWQGVKDIFSSIVTGFSNIFKKPINAIIDGINSFIGGLNKLKIPDWVPGVGGFGFNLKKIPKLAQGGYVKANTPQLAMIGDNKTQGEIVSPEGKMFDVMMEALRAYGSNNANREDIQVIVSILYEILEAIKNLKLIVDGDSLNDDQKRRDKERALRTGKLITG